MTQTDLIPKRGLRAIAGQLNRPVNQIYRDGAEVSRDQLHVPELCWFHILFVLIRKKSCSITALPDKIGLTHAAINQIVGQLGRHGYASSAKDTIEACLLRFPGITSRTEAIAVIIRSLVE